MPKQVLPSVQDFAYLSDELKALGFREITYEKFREIFKRSALKAPRPREGREVGFIFSASRLYVTVWTTWLKNQNRAAKSDEAWVIIENRNRALYFSHPMHRTKNFVKNLLTQTWIARKRVINRPFCPECGRFMHIEEGKGIKSRYWQCPNKGKHKNNRTVFLGWDHGLPPKAKKYLKTVRKRRTRYRDKLKEQGKPLNQAMIKRKRWIRTKTT